MLSHNQILPIYIQKIIIKLLCKHIDYNNKVIDIFQISSSKFDPKANQIKNDKLIMSIALVCHEWFKTLSNNLTVSVDLNFKERGNDKWSIIKRDNLKTLHLHYDPINSTFFKKMIYTGDSNNNNKNKNKNNNNNNNNNNKNNKNSNKNNNNNKNKNNKNKIPIQKRILIGLKNLNEKLMKLSTEQKQQQLFNRLIINTIDNISFQEEDYKMIQSLYQCKAIKNIHLFRYQVNNRTTMKSLQDIKKRVRKLYTLEIVNQFDKRIIIESIKHWYGSIRKLIIEYDNYMQPTFSDGYSEENSFRTNSELYEFLFTKIIEKEKEINYLSNLESLSFKGTQFTIQDLVELIFSNQTTSIPKLKYLSIGLCFINLIYFLTNENERGQISRCVCNSIIRFNSENNNNNNNSYFGIVTKEQLEEQTKEFNSQWSQLLQLLNNNQVLIGLELTHSCNNQLSKSEPSQSFIINFTSAITSIKNLQKFSLVGIESTTIFNQITKENKSISLFNLTTFSSPQRLESLSKEIQQLIDLNPHINEFQLLNGKFIPENYDYLYTTEFNFKKKQLKEKNK
ncbi:hypothetical protein ACTFIU_010047 [Dictyostelium citrinum]